MAPPRRGPGRNFKRVPPKGRKPIKRLPYKKPFEPYVYEGLFDEGAFEAFIEDANPINWPRKSQENIVKSINTSLSVKYKAGRASAIDIETTEQERMDLPGASGAGVSVNLKDWLDDPEKQLQSTTKDWWKSVFNWEDLTSNTEHNLFWTPLLTGENKALTYVDSGGNHHVLSLTEKVAGKVVGAGGPLLVSTGSTTSPDFYKKISTDVLRWVDVSGSRSDRLNQYTALQADLLTAVDAQLNPTEMARLLADPLATADTKRLITKWQTLQTNVLASSTQESAKSILDRAAGVSAVPTGYEKVFGFRGRAAGAGFAMDRRWDVVKNQITEVTDAFGGTIKNLNVAGITALGASFLPGNALLIAAQVRGRLDPEVAKYNKAHQLLVDQQKEMMVQMDDAWHELLSQGEDVLMQLGMSEVEAVRMATWQRLINYREAQSTAYDFIEAIDGKKFFRTFIWSGRFNKYIPGLANRFRYLSPADYITASLKKVNNFGLDGSFNQVSSNWQPFAKVAKVVEDTMEKVPFANSVIKALSLGLVEKENFVYTYASGAAKAVKVTFADTSFLTGAAGLVDKAGKVITDSDWKVLDFIQKATTTFDAAGNPLIGEAALRNIFSTNPAISATKVASLTTAFHTASASAMSGAGGAAADALKTLANDTQIQAAFEHFRTVSEDPQMQAMFAKFGLLDPTSGELDFGKFSSFAGDINKAKLGNKYIGFITSAGRKLDHYQGVAFKALYARVPFLKGPIEFFRGSWIKNATANPKLLAKSIETAVFKFGGGIATRLGLSVATKAAIKAAITRAIAIFSNSVMPVIGPIIGAVLAWIGGKILGKIFKAIKGPATDMAKTLWKINPLHWVYFTNYGFLGTGEDVKMVSCVSCVGCSFIFVFLPIFLIMTISGANYKFSNDLVAPGTNAQIEVTKLVSPMTLAAGGGDASYTITVKNTSSDPLLGVTITDNYQSAAGVTSITCTNSPTSTSDPITWGVAQLTAGQTWSATCQAHIATATDKFITNVVNVAGTIKGTSAVNMASATIKVGSPAVTAPCGWIGPGQAVGPVTADCAWHQANEGYQAADIGYGLGAPLYSPLEGTITRCVITVNNSSSLNYGVYVLIESNDHTYKVRMAHLQPLPGEKDGDGCGSPTPIGVGSLVGNVGITGFTTGAHVHYEIQKAGGLVCPVCYLRSLVTECGGLGC